MRRRRDSRTPPGGRHRRRVDPRLLLPLAVVALSGVILACGTRGSPRPPFDPKPPTIEDLEVAQSGYDAIVQLRQPAPELEDGSDTMAVPTLEILVATERYPVLTPGLLADALEEERQRRLEEARAAAASVAASMAARERAEDEEGTGETDEEPEPESEPPLPEDAGGGEREEEPDAEEGERTAAERELIGRVPMPRRRQWRAEGVRGDALVEAGRQLGEAVSDLWEILDLPAAIVDLEQPPPLPPRHAVLEAARRVSRTLGYERQMTRERLLQLTSESISVDLQEGVEEYRVVQEGEPPELFVPYTVGLPGDGTVRTRYFFAARTETRRGRQSELSAVASLAPGAVPVPPTGLTAEVVANGVELDWDPPVADLHGRLLLGGELRFRVFRGAPGGPLAPLSGAVLPRSRHVDTTISWDEEYVYEIRARFARVTAGAENGGAATSRGDGDGKESAGARVGPLAVVDVHPPAPAADVRASRVGSRVTVQWAASSSDDVAGYRVYRHPAPAPPPVDLPEVDDEVEGESDAGEDGSPATIEESPPALEDASAGEDAPAAPPGTEQLVGGLADRPGLAELRSLRRQRQRRLERRLDSRGWDRLTDELVREPRFVDPDVEPEGEYVYLVLAVDDAGNASSSATAATGTEAGP